jgi:hypothetical protein
MPLISTGLDLISNVPCEFIFPFLDMNSREKDLDEAEYKKN